MFLLSGVPALWNAKPIPLGQRKAKKKQILCDLCVCGDYKLSNYNTVPYLRIRVLRFYCPKNRRPPENSAALTLYNF